MARYIDHKAAQAAKYPFVALPTSDGEGWEIVFPDVPGVVGFSTNWDGIGSEAEAILRLHLDGLADEGLPIPAPHPDWDPIQRKAEDFRLPEIFSSEEVAGMLGVSVRRVQALARDRARGTMVGKSLVFTLDDVRGMQPGPTGRPRKAEPVSAD